MVGFWNLGLKMIPNDRPRSSLGPPGDFGQKIPNKSMKHLSLSPGPLRNFSIFSPTFGPPCQRNLVGGPKGPCRDKEQIGGPTGPCRDKEQMARRHLGPGLVLLPETID